MAELLAYGKDVSGFSVRATRHTDGSGVIDLSSSAYRPELRLSAAEVAAILAGLSGVPQLLIPPVIGVGA